MCPGSRVPGREDSGSRRSHSRILWNAPKTGRAPRMDDLTIVGISTRSFSVHKRFSASNVAGGAPEEVGIGAGRGRVQETQHSPIPVSDLPLGESRRQHSPSGGVHRMGRRPGLIKARLEDCLLLLWRGGLVSFSRHGESLSGYRYPPHVQHTRRTEPRSGSAADSWALSRIPPSLRCAPCYARRRRCSRTTFFAPL